MPLYNICFYWGAIAATASLLKKNFSFIDHCLTKLSGRFIKKAVKPSTFKAGIYGPSNLCKNDLKSFLHCSCKLIKYEHLPWEPGKVTLGRYENASAVQQAQRQEAGI